MIDKSKNNKKRILYCESNFDGTVGGSYYSLLFLATGLDQSKFEPVVVFRKSTRFIEEFRKLGVTTHIIPHPRPLAFKVPDSATSIFYRISFPGLRIIQKAINFIRFLPIAAIKCAWMIRRDRIDLVHLNNSIIRNNEWMLGAQLARVPAITHERGINDEYPRLARYYARKLDCVICISQAVRENLLDKGVEPRRTETIYNGIDPDLMRITQDAATVRSAHGISTDAKVIGVMGNIREWKGQETAVRAMPTILKYHPNTICLFVGDVSPSDQYYYDDLVQLIKDLGLENKVVFTGYTDQVANYLGALDIMLHTSIRPEPFGRVLIEAMSLQTPIVGAAAGAVPEIIDNGTSGYTFQPGDASDLSEKVIQMLDDSERSARMAGIGYHRLLKYFHIKSNVKLTQSLYQEILNC